MKTRTLTYTIGMAAVLSTLCLTATEASAQYVARGRALGGGRVYNSRVYTGGVYGPRVYGGGVYAPRVYGGGVYGPRVYVTGPMLAPPVYAPAPVMVAPPPMMAPSYAVAQPAPMIYARPEFESTWGLGIHGVFVGADAQTSGGIGGHLRYRASRWAGLELSVDYLRVDVDKTTRQDVPVMAAALIYLAPGRFAPYLLVGGGMNFARATFANGLKDEAQQLAAQGGGGIELRIGRQLALNADLRYIYRDRLGNANDAARSEASTVHNVGTEQGAQLNIGATFYF
jgi:hypothetical protein